MRSALSGLRMVVPVLMASLICVCIVAIISLDVVFSARKDFPMSAPKEVPPTAPGTPEECLRMPEGLMVCDSPD